MGEIRKSSKVLSIINKTNETMRDIEITYDGIDGSIEILKIKSDYEKTIVLHSSGIADLVDLTMKYNGESYIIYKNLDFTNEVNIRLEVFKAQDGKLDIKSFLFI